MNKKALWSLIVILAIIVVFVIAFIFIPDFSEERDSDDSDLKMLEDEDSKVISPDDVMMPGEEASYSEKISLSEIIQHDSKEDCWTAINGKVYDVTSFIPDHPGGDAILKVCGTDGTEVFTGKHGNNNNAKEELENHYIGDLE